MICSNCHNEIGDASPCPYCGAPVLKSPLPHHLPAEALIGGRYRVSGVLGEGGFGITYLARDHKLNLPVAVKEYYPRGFSYRSHTGNYAVYVGSKDDEAFYTHGKERFLQEARTLARFSEEPGVVSVTDYIEENNTVYLVMEYLRGQTLQQYLKQRGRISADEAFTMLGPVMKTLEKIHAAGVIHRDISPDNIMVLQNGSVKLMDFGAAKEYIDESRSMSVMLKKGYAPEEQYRRNGRQGPWTDVYALCATVYRCITGNAPEESLDRLAEDTLQKPSQLGADISRDLEQILLYGLAVRKDDRCQSMTELLRLLERPRTEDRDKRLVDPVGMLYVGNEPNHPDATMIAEEQTGVPVTQGGSERHVPAPVPPVPVPRTTVPSTTVPRTTAPPAPAPPVKRVLTVVIIIAASVVIISLVVFGIILLNRDTDPSGSDAGSALSPDGTVAASAASSVGASHAAETQDPEAPADTSGGTASQGGSSASGSSSQGAAETEASSGGSSGGSSSAAETTAVMEVEEPSEKTVNIAVDLPTEVTEEVKMKVLVDGVVDSRFSQTVIPAYQAVYGLAFRVTKDTSVVVLLNDEVYREYKVNYDENRVDLVNSFPFNQTS